jgi:hypothetical protein
VFGLIRFAEPFQFAHLRVNQRVHGIDDERVHPSFFCVPLERSR